MDSIPICDACRVVVLQLEIPIPTIKHILRACKAKGRVSSSPS